MDPFIQMFILTPWAKPPVSIVTGTAIGDPNGPLKQDGYSKDGKPIIDFEYCPEASLAIADGKPYYKMKRGSESALCFDLRANVDITLGRGQQAKIPTGVSIAMPDHMGCLMRERSGLADRGLRLGAGTLDADYRGEYKVLLRYEPCVDVLEPARRLPDVFTIFKGDRIVQMYFAPEDASRLRWRVVSDVKEMPASFRGEKGFGSSGMGALG